MKTNDLRKQGLNIDDKVMFKAPNLYVDTVIFTLIDNALHVLTIKRNIFPYKGMWSLVGGYVDINLDDTLESTALRKLEEKTGLKTPYLEQCKTIGNRTRDPRGWSATTIYFALISSQNIKLKAGKGASDVKWEKVKDGKISDKLAFDHMDILTICMQRLKAKVLYTSLPIYLLPEIFTLSELQSVYEIILDKKLDGKSFRRRILNAKILETTGEMKKSGRRPAKCYRLKAQTPHYFVRNIERV